jgi:hypothetical protein
MLHYPELNWPTFSSFYDGKGVVFHARRGGEPLEIEGILHVSGDGRGMHVQYVVDATEGSRTEEQLPIDQTVLENVARAPKELSDAFGGRVAFVIQIPLVLR